MSSGTSITSRVVPGCGETIATSRRASALTSVDLPAFGGPMTAISMPSRMRSPRPASSRWPADLRLQPAHARRATSAAIPAGRSSSAKSISASRCASARKQPVPPAVVKGAERAAELGKRLPPLRRGLRRNQIGEAFDGGQIEPAVGEGAPAELARFRRPQPGKPAERRKHRRDHRAAAVDVQFDHVLAGKAGGARETTERGRCRGARRRRAQSIRSSRRSTARRGVGNASAGQLHRAPPPRLHRRYG